MPQKSAKTTTKANESSAGFSAAERAAMKERAKELKAAARRDAKKEDAEQEVLAKIAELPEPDRTLAERIHALVKATAPSLAPRTYYGMPAYANEAGKVVCFFTPASKFDERYATFGFNADANLDEGSMWATSFALTKWTDDNEAKLGKLIKQAVS